MPADPLDIAALRALLEKATPLPWAVDPAGVGNVEIMYRNPSVHNNGMGVSFARRYHAAGDADAQDVADAAYAAAACSTLPALLSEIERLRKVEAAAKALDLSDPWLSDAPDDELVVCRRDARTWRELRAALQETP